MFGSNEYTRRDAEMDARQEYIDECFLESEEVRAELFNIVNEARLNDEIIIALEGHTFNEWFNEWCDDVTLYTEEEMVEQVKGVIEDLIEEQGVSFIYDTLPSKKVEHFIQRFIG